MGRDAKGIKQAFEKKKSARSQWDEQMQEIAEYCFPAAADQNRVYSKYQEKRDRLKVNDSTAVQALTLLARAIHGSVTPPNLPWVDFRLRNSKASTRRDVKEWIGQVKEIIQNKLNESNFDDEASVFYKYNVGFGTSALFMEDDWNEREQDWGFLFTALSPAEIYFSEDYRGYVNEVYRPYKYTLQQVKEKWPEALERSGKLSKDYTRDPEKEIDIIHFISPKRDGERTNNKDHRYISKHVACEYEVILNAESSNGYYTFPCFVVRWERIRNNEMGNSPARDALPFIKTLNDAVGLQLESYDKALNPPLLALQGSYDGDADLSSRAVNEVYDLNAIQPLLDGARYDVAEFLVSNAREEIKRMFFADQIQITQEGKTPPSATQVSASLEMKNRILGPMFGRHKFELLNTMIDRAFDILNRRGLLPEPPIALEEDAVLDPEYVGPLARAQKMAQAEQIINYLFTRSQIMQQVPPEVLGQTPELMFKINYSKVEDFIADSMGVSDLGFFNTEQEVQEKINELEQQRQRQQLLQGAEQGAGAVKDLATAQKIANGG